MTSPDLRATLAAVVTDQPGLRLAPPPVRMPAGTDPVLTAITITTDIINVRLVATRLPVTAALHTLTARLDRIAERIEPRRLRLHVIDIDPAALDPEIISGGSTAEGPK